MLDLRAPPAPMTRNGRCSATLPRAALLARRLARCADETSLVRALADAVRRLVAVERAWVLLLHESSGEYTEGCRWPDSAGGPRIAIGIETVADLRMGQRRAGLKLRDPRLIGPAGRTLAQHARVALFAPHGVEREPPLLLLVEQSPGRAPDARERSALQLVADAAGAALERRRLAARLELYRTDAERDFLTGIYNRRLTLRLLEREIGKARRTRSKLSVVMIDVDNFKGFNDTYGHLAGDDLLRALARLFVSSARSTDVIGRFGGEEFLVLLPDAAAEEASIFAERLRQDVQRFGRESRMQFRDHELTISMGVASVVPSDTPESAIARADRALYESKNRGRNCFSLGLPDEDPA